jgi:hypothetical protein
MKVLFAALCLAFVTACSAQVISRQQLTNYAVGMNGGSWTNGRHVGTLRLTNDPVSLLSPSIYFEDSLSNGVTTMEWRVGAQEWSIFASTNSWKLTQFTPFFPSHLEIWPDGSTSIGIPGSTVTNNADLRVTGIAYDLNGQRFVNTIDASNNVRVAAGAGTLVSASGAGGVMTYTVTSTAGAGATNAISAVQTNGGIGGIGLTSIAFNNGYGNTVSGVSNSGAFTLTFTVDFTAPTNYANAVFTSLSNFASQLAYTIGANSTNFGFQIGANATSYVNTATVNITNALTAKQDGFAALTELGNSGIRFPGTASMIESNVNQIFWNLQRMTVATNSSTSNLVINLRTNKYYFHATNNITVTNLTGINEGVASDTTIIIEPQLIPRGIAYPTLGGSSFGIYANTNDNSPMWTTLTNGNRYALTISSFGTNTFWSISRWK